MPFRSFDPQRVTPAAISEADQELALRIVELSGDASERRRQLVRGWRRSGWLMLSALGVVGFVLGFCGARGTPWAKLREALHLFPSGFPGAANPSDRVALIAGRY